MADTLNLSRYYKKEGWDSAVDFHKDKRLLMHKFSINMHAAVR